MITAILGVAMVFTGDWRSRAYRGGAHPSSQHFSMRGIVNADASAAPLRQRAADFEV
jgi:hypothetical protein